MKFRVFLWSKCVEKREQKLALIETNFGLIFKSMWLQKNQVIVYREITDHQQGEISVVLCWFAFAHDQCNYFVFLSHQNECISFIMENLIYYFLIQEKQKHILNIVFIFFKSLEKITHKGTHIYRQHCYSHQLVQLTYIPP